MRIIYTATYSRAAHMAVRARRNFWWLLWESFFCGRSCQSSLSIDFGLGFCILPRVSLRDLMAHKELMNIVKQCDRNISNRHAPMSFWTTSYPLLQWSSVGRSQLLWVALYSSSKLGIAPTARAGKTCEPSRTLMQVHNSHILRPIYSARVSYRIDIAYLASGMAQLELIVVYRVANWPKATIKTSIVTTAICLLKSYKTTKRALT